MEIGKAVEIISALANGIDPYTGEVMSKDSPYQNPDTVRALFLALKGLGALESREKRVNNLPGNAGKPWSHEEEQELITAFDQGISIKELSVKHGRTHGAIQSRLIKMGKLTV